MNYHDIDWAASFRAQAEGTDKVPVGSEESRQMWDEKAASFARKPKRSGYIHQLIGLLALAPGETVLDVGCGSGTLAIPLAQAGHDVFALDFSRGMLDELHAAAQAAGVDARDATGGGADFPARCAPANTPAASPGVADKHGGAPEPRKSDAGAGHITVCQRSWQESWDDLPRASVAMSSRSLLTTDIADAVRKLEAHATARVAITVGAGDLPYRDHRVLAAMGRHEEAAMDPLQLVTILNYLFEMGRLPRLNYIETPGVWHRATQGELEEAIRRGHEPRSVDEERALSAYLKQHVVYNEELRRFELDYPRVDRWAYVEWSPVR